MWLSLSSPSKGAPYPTGLPSRQNPLSRNLFNVPFQDEIHSRLGLGRRREYCPLMVFQYLNPFLDIAGVLGAVGNAASNAKESRPHFSDQFLDRIGLIAIALPE